MLTWKLLKEGTCSKERRLCGENNHCTLTTGVSFFTQGHLPAGDFLDVVGVLFVGSWVASLDPLENPQNLFLGAGQVPPLHSPSPEEGGVWDLFSRQEDPVHLPWTEGCSAQRQGCCLRSGSGAGSGLSSALPCGWAQTVSGSDPSWPSCALSGPPLRVCGPLGTVGSRARGARGPLSVPRTTPSSLASCPALCSSSK